MSRYNTQLKKMGFHPSQSLAAIRSNLSIAYGILTINHNDWLAASIHATRLPREKRGIPRLIVVNMFL